MTLSLTTDAPSAGGDARKTREFTATLLGALVAPGIGTGVVASGTGPSDAPVYRPLWVAFGGTPGQLTPFAANVRMGRAAVHREHRDRVSYGVEVVRSAEYEWHTHAIPGGYEVRSAFLRGPFAVDPGFVDPDRVAFVVAPSRAWLSEQPPPPVPLDAALDAAAPWLLRPTDGHAIPAAVRALLDADRPGGDGGYRRTDTYLPDTHPAVVAWREGRERAAEAQWRAHQRTLGVRDVDRIRRIAPLATAYLDRRIAAPILADPVFHVRLWCRILAESRTRCPGLQRQPQGEPVGTHAGGWSAFLLDDAAWTPTHALAPPDGPPAARGGAVPGPDPIGEWLDTAWAAEARDREAEIAAWKADNPGKQHGPARYGYHGPHAFDPPSVAADWGSWARGCHPNAAFQWSRGLADTFAEVLAVCLEPGWVRAVLAAETRAYLRGTPVERLEYTSGARDPAADAPVTGDTEARDDAPEGDTDGAV